MTAIPANPASGGATAEPAWEVARLFPDQGAWSEEEYLALPGNRLVELSHGCIEVLVMPTTAHQGIVAFLYAALVAIVKPRSLGRARFAPLRVRLWEGKFREPDVVFMLAEHDSQVLNEYWVRADLVMEVVSDDDRRRDLDTKRREYAQAGIPEYWIVDPREGRVTVLKLAGDRYAVHGEFAAGQVATSVLLPDFKVDVAATFAAAND